MSEIELLKDLQQTDTERLAELFAIPFDDARQLMCYLCLDGVLVPIEDSGRYRVVQAALLAADRIPYARCAALCEELWEMNPYSYGVIEAQNGYLPRGEYDLAECLAMEKMGLLYEQGGKWYNRLPKGCTRLITETLTHYTDFIYRYRLVEPLLYAMAKAGEFPEEILKSPMILRRNRALLRILLEQHQKRGIDLSPKEFAGKNDRTEQFIRGFVESALCEFDCEDYVSATLPYRKALLDCPYLPFACKAALEKVPAAILRKKKNEIEFERRFYKRSFLPEAVASFDMFDDALF